MGELNQAQACVNQVSAIKCLAGLLLGANPFVHTFVVLVNDMKLSSLCNILIPVKFNFTLGVNTSFFQRPLDLVVASGGSARHFRHWGSN